MLISAGISFNAGIQSGLAFYLGPAPAILAEAVGVIAAVKSANAGSLRFSGRSRRGGAQFRWHIRCKGRRRR